MKKLLFVIHNMDEGGAQKVLVNLVNNMDTTKFKISVLALFGGGINACFLKDHVNYRCVFPNVIRGNKYFLKLIPPQLLYAMFVKEKYDIVVSYLEGVSARVVSGCIDKDTKLVSWIHVEQHSKRKVSEGFWSYSEAKKCYQKFDNIICVSQYVKQDFLSIIPEINSIQVLYNTNESEKILKLAKDIPTEMSKSRNEFIICGVGSLKKSKGFDRLIRIHKLLLNECGNIRTFILGVGPEEQRLKEMARKMGVQDSLIFLGYKTNPYSYVANCDLFVCTSWAEGFSTAATEALIVGTPVCTVDVSGMKEMLGEHNEYGIVTDNSDDALYKEIKRLIINKEYYQYYKLQAKKRGELFSTSNTVQCVEGMFMKLLKGGQ